MCGIVGYVQSGINSGEIDVKYRNALMDLLFMDSLRGVDSTGVAVIPKDKDKKPFVIKQAIPGYEFIELKEYQRIFTAQRDPGIFIGHNRAATKGEISNANAHPFVAEHITLVHNGSIHNMYSLDAKTQSQVDSCHIAHAIALYGAEHVLKKIDGPAVLVWYDSKENSMNIARTKDREIRWIFDIHGTCWFASEREMLWTALSRNKIAPKGEFLTIPEYHHFKWELSEKMGEIGTLVRTAFPEFKPIWQSGYQQGQQDWTKHNQGGSNMGKGVGQGMKALTCSSTGQRSTDGQTTDDELKRHEKISKRKIANIDKKLNSYELAVGDEILVQRLQWVPSKKSADKGDIICNYPAKNIKVIMPDVPQSLWERQGSGQYAVVVYNIVQEIIPKQGKHQPVLYAKLKNYQIKDLVQGPNGCLITREEFKELAGNNCLWCAQAVYVGNHEITEWVNGRPLCQPCSHNFSERTSVYRH